MYDFDINFDLDRLADPKSFGLRFQSGVTTSDGVTLISNQEFHKNDVIIHGTSFSDAVRHSKALEEIARKMGFRVFREQQTKFSVEGRKIIHQPMSNPRYASSKPPCGTVNYYLSAVTHELCSFEFFRIHG